jgi:putative ATP-dependent endonuclease of OLD family
MFLRELHVEHLRAIRSATVRFDASTTLIGENDSGKGSLLRGLELMLGSDRVPGLNPTDFHHPRGADSPEAMPRIALTFEEREPGEWSSPWHAPLVQHLSPSQKPPRLVIVQAIGVPGTNGDRPALRLEVHGVTDETACRTIVEHVRATTPLIHVTGGTLTGHSSAEIPETTRPVPGPAAEPAFRLVEQILEAADELLSGRATNPESCIEAGAQAARTLLAASPRHVDPASSELASSILEILGVTAQAPARSQAARPETMTLADRLGTFLLLAAVLRRMPAGLPPGVDPLWIIEDPEAHLHPMTLVATERLLARIRWQKIVTTHSGDLLAATPLAQIRRLVRHDGLVRAFGPRPRALSREILRRVGYHLRTHRGVAMFARLWLLVEGESEFWILPQVAQVMGHDLAMEGICPVGFAQCGIDPLVRTAREFGIEWHLLADGDEAGRQYVDAARHYIGPGEEHDRVTFLPEHDIEHCFWHSGHAGTIMEVAGLAPETTSGIKPGHAISKAVHRKSKPFLALRLVESVAAQGPAGVPPPLARLIETCVELARSAPRRGVGSIRAHS